MHKENRAEQYRSCQDQNKDHPFEASHVINVVIFARLVEESQVDDKNLHCDRNDLKLVQFPIVERLQFDRVDARGEHEDDGTE